MHISLMIAVSLLSPAMAPVQPQAGPPMRVDVSPPRVPAPDPEVRRLRIGGFVGLGLGSGLLGLSIGSMTAHGSGLRWLAAQDAALGQDGRVSPFLRERIRQESRDARIDRGVAIGTGISAAACFAVGAVLLGLARGRTRANGRLALAPLWLSSGTGLVLRVRLP